MKQKNNLTQYLVSRKKLVDLELLRRLKHMKPSKFVPKDYLETLDHSVLEGGKRLRPIMTMAVYELYNKLDKQIVNASCVTELFHAGSLMLDDLPCMDNAEFRRGKRSSHSQFGESMTILSGAALWFEAYNIIASLDSPHIANLVRKTSSCMGGKGLVQGQLLDLESFNSVQTVTDLKLCYTLKTSVMFDLAATIGSVLAGANTSDQKLLSGFAISFGVAYQIRDDILDATQSFEQTGKDTKSDEKNNKPNYVSLLGVEGAKVELSREITHAIECLDKLGRDDSNLRALVMSLVF